MSSKLTIRKKSIGSLEQSEKIHWLIGTLKKIQLQSPKLSHLFLAPFKYGWISRTIWWKRATKILSKSFSKTIKASSLLWHTRWWLVVWKAVYTIKSMFFIDLKRLLKMSVHKSISIWVFTLLLPSLKRLEVLHIIQVRCKRRLPIATKTELIIIFCRNNESSWNFNQENPLWKEELTVFVTGDRNNRF